LEDLDEITKLEVDGLKLDLKPFDIVDLTREIFDSLALMAKERHIELTMAKDYKSIQVFADRGKIAQVLTNLITNSISYGSENGVTILRFYAIDDLVTIEVSDNGPGIEESQLPRLFERFYRVEKSRNRNEGGSGLGLAIVKHILESHGQTISVRSTVGLGSTFTFSLDKPRAGSSPILNARVLQL
jgi:two-component system phosphate regulon sensor histidine kinase PhoR